MINPSEAWLQRVRYTAAEPTAWLNHARTLRQAAEDLWIAGMVAPPPPEMGGSTCDVCFMLFGFALENLAKGIIVCRDPKRVSRRNLKDWHRKGPQLATLFDGAAIPLTSEERDTLERTSRTVEWRGRYPVPMDFYKVHYGDQLIGYVAPSNIWPADEYAPLSVLYGTANAALIRAMQDVPALPVDYDFGDASRAHPILPV